MNWQTVDDYSYINELKNGSWSLWIHGPRGIVGGEDLGEYPNPTRKILDRAYWSFVHTLDGHYHCCLTGRVRIF
jgi:hypothetical protein